MIVCSCKGITDRTIRALIREGSCSIRDIGQQCDAGRGCGGCKPTIVHLVQLVTSEKRQRETSRDMMKGYER